MLKLSLRIIILIVLVVFGLQQTDSIFYKDHFYRDTINQYQKSDKDFDIVFFGNSHSHSSFDPRIFELELDAKAINLGSPSQRLVITKVVIDMVLKNKKPDLAVVNIFSLSLNESNNERYKTFQLEALDFLPLTWSKANTIFEMFPVSEWPTAFSKTLRYHFNWDDISSVSKPYEYPGNYDTHLGFSTYKTSYDDKSYSKFEKKFGDRDVEVTSLNSLEKKRIDDIIKIFKDNDVPVLFVNAPDAAYDISDNFKTYAIQIGKYLNSKGQNILDFNLIKDSLGLTRTDYRDPNHLNTKGAIKTSKYLAGYISKQYDLNGAISKEELMKNRYYLAKNDFENTIKSVSLEANDSIVQGLKKIHLYHAGNNKMEFLFEIDTTSFKDVKLTTQYGTSPNLPINKKERSWPTISKKDVIHYNDSSFLVITLYAKQREVFDLKVTINGDGYPTLFENEQLKL